MIAATTSREGGRDWPPLPEREHRPLHQAVLTALGPLEGRCLLDVGCGVGSFLRAAQRRGALVAGTDSAVTRLEVARWALPDADLRLTEPGDALPFDNGTFDVVTTRTAEGSAVLAEPARVVRPGGLVAVGTWARPRGCWTETFAGHLRRLALLPPETDDDPAAELAAAGLTVRGGGNVRFTATFPNSAAAWRAMLTCEDMLSAIGAVGEAAVREAFADSVSGNVAPDGTVCLPKTFRYAVAATGESTSWSSGHRPDNESASVSDQDSGRD
ncbi:class I SAM-dependent methyltransferase [Actinophytocola oryzae]|uniref:Methyltransferase family protein n=1 Tax=Actinophytocola oryzae TaxID=502181 RepID=A0A4R7V043_9PSEU|nr:class I SAM-dependent methyltransferase [Actinophytocola oryzae]TDV42613.1 methyltransferase family protein [Actinophytocola oryzae]